MRESQGTMRVYCGLVGAVALYTGTFGIRGLFAGLVTVFGGGLPWIPWFTALWILSPLLQLGAGVVLLYVSWQLPRLLESEQSTTRFLFGGIAVLLLAHGLVDAAMGFLLSLAASAFGVLIVWYLYSNAQRLSRSDH